MNVKTLKIKEVLIINSDKHKDERGWFQETYHLQKFLDRDINHTFVQDNLVYSNKNVLRGLHANKKQGQGKLVSCIKGKIFDVAVDLRPDSNTYKQWVGYFLTEDDSNFLYIPRGFAHGYSVESEDALVNYKCTEIYNPDEEFGIIWDDPDINIAWPQNSYIISERDKKNMYFKELKL